MEMTILQHGPLSRKMLLDNLRKYVGTEEAPPNFVLHAYRTYRSRYGVYWFWVDFPSPASSLWMRVDLSADSPEGLIGTEMIEDCDETDVALGLTEGPFEARKTGDSWSDWEGNRD